MNEEKENTINRIRFNEPSTKYAFRHTMTNSSSCSRSSSIGTHRAAATAAAAAAALGMHKYMPGIYVVQYYISGPRDTWL